MTHDTARNNLKTLGATLGGPFRNHAHPRHHDAIDSYVRFIDAMLGHLEHLETQMSKISDALNKRTNERDQWKAYAQSQQGLVDAANTAAQTAQAAEKAAEDRLAAIPIIPDADDVTAVDAVIAAADDLPPAAPPA